MSKNNQQLTSGNAACENQRLTIKHCLKECPNGGIAERNTISRENTENGLGCGEDDEVP